MGSGPGALLCLSLCLLVSRLVEGALVNRTIDDWFGDSETGVRPVFAPNTPGVWKDELCNDCAIEPDTRRAFRGTYTAATWGGDADPISVTLQFEGTAIYVFFILANNEGDGITTDTECEFILDNSPPVRFRHVPNLSTTEILFNQLAFSRTNIPNGRHTLRIVTGGLDHNIYVNFDYAIYTHDDAVSSSVGSGGPSSSATPSSLSSVGPRPSASISSSVSSSFAPSGSVRPSGSPSTPASGEESSTPSDAIESGGSSGGDSQKSSTPVGAIVGGVLGGLAILGLLAFLLFCFVWRRKRSPPPPGDRINIMEQLEAHDQPLPSAAYTSGLPPQARLPIQPPPSSFGGYGNNLLAPPAADGNAYWSPYGGIAELGSQTDNTPSNPSETSRRRLVALNADPPSPLGVPQHDQIRRVRQEELDRQMATVQQEMSELDQNLKRGTSFRRRTMPNEGGEEREMTVDEMKAQMRIMQQQIEFLRDNQRSDWAAGLTDDPPPGYTPDPIPYLTAPARPPLPPLPPVPSNT